jgi:prepilin-type N-terminal cleavage/methylation domain-containing protein
MRTGLRRRALGTPSRPPTRLTDGGFSLVEVMVSIMLIGIILTALTSFFVSTNSVTNYQRGKQVAVQLAGDAAERVRGLQGSAVIVGRDADSTANQVQVPGVAAYLVDATTVSDSSAPTGTGATAALPTAPRDAVVNGITYRQHWYVGACWQALGGGDCSKTVQEVAFYRIVVAVTWSDRRCPSSACTYVTSTLVSSVSQDPVFDKNAGNPPPAVTNPGNLTNTVNVALTRTLVATGGAPPLTWSGVNLPPGLGVGSDGKITGTPPTTGVYSVTVSATDSFGKVGTAAFNWTINPAPTLTNPGNQAGVRSTAVSLTIAIAGGTAPITWSAPGLPTGLSINTAGVISGTPSTVGNYSVTVTATDNSAKAATAAFTWTIIEVPPSLTSPGNQSSQKNKAISPLSMNVHVTGGTTPRTWGATNLPTGLSINASTGAITGTPWNTKSNFAVSVTVTDFYGRAATVSFNWDIP